MSEPADVPSLEGDSGRPNDGRRDALLVALLLGAFLAARLLVGTPLVLAVAVLLLGIARVRAPVFVAGLLLLIGWHAGVQLDRLDAASTGPRRDVVVELVSDPVERSGSIRAEVELHGQRLLLSARTSRSRDLRRAATGDRFTVTGTVRGSAPESDWRISRRLVGTLAASELRLAGRAGGATGAANTMRETLRHGTSGLSDEQQALFTGLVFGDDRDQGVLVADNFRASGLGHLLAVSGQNVVFVLLLASPLISRIRWPALRVGGALLVLVSFGFLTRFEPSVSRAIVMAGLALMAQALGRPGAAPLVLPPCVLGLLLLDPLLAWSLAFQLSVAATTGLVVLAPRLVERLPGPHILTMTMSATLSAQLAVSPLLLWHFDTVSAVAVPANVLAAPAAAAVMMWGLVGGLAAGLVASEFAAAFHVPTSVLLWWIDRVAASCARVPLGHVGVLHTSIFALGIVLVVIASSPSVQRPAVARLAGLVLIGLLSATLVNPRPLAAGEHRLTDGVTALRSHSGRDVLVIDRPVREDDAIRAIRLARLGRIDSLVAVDGSRATGALVFLIQERFDVVETWAPRGHEVPGARTFGEIG